MSSITNSLRHVAPRAVTVRQLAENDIFDTFFADPFGRFGRLQPRRRPFFESFGNFNNLSSRFDNDDFFQSIDRHPVEDSTGNNNMEDTEMTDASPHANGFSKSWSYSSVTRNGKTVLSEKKKYLTSDGKMFERHERKLPDGRSMVSDSRNDVMLADQQPIDGEVDPSSAETFEHDFQQSFYGRRDNEQQQLEPSEPAPTLQDAEKVEQEKECTASSSQTARRLNHLADLHDQGLLSDAEFLAAKEANHSSL